MQVPSLSSLLLFVTLLTLQFPGGKPHGPLPHCRLIGLDVLRGITRSTRINYNRLLSKPRNNGKQKTFNLFLLLLILLLAGDVHPHPGPPKTKIPCAVCTKSTATKQLSIDCDICKQPTHRTCANLSLTEYRVLKNTSAPWKCESCKNLVNVTIYPCGVCNHHVPEDNYSILCSYCDYWIHLSCSGLKKEQLLSYDGDGIYYTCPNCVLPFQNCDISLGKSFLVDSDNESSFLSVNTNASIDTSHSDKSACAFLSQSFPKNFKIAHLNINSFKNKFYDCVDVLHSGIFDIIAFSESKLGPSYYTTQYIVNGYKPPLRADKSTRSGGLILYIKDNIQFIRHQKLFLPHFETIAFEFYINDKKWFLVHTYRTPTKTKEKLELFYSELKDVLDKALISSENVILLGDINIDLSDKKFSSDYSDLLNCFNMSNVIKDKTCFKNSDKPTLIDHMCTNKPRSVKSSGVIDTGLSDFHRLTYLVLKSFKPKPLRHTLVYRSYKNTKPSEFVKALDRCPFHVADIFDDVDDKFYVFNQLFSDVVNTLYPLRERQVKYKPPPYMNPTYRRELYTKAHLDNVRWKYPNKTNFELFRLQRNKCVKVKNQSLRKYMASKCGEGPSGGKKFWNTVGPFVNSKSSNKTSHIDLIEENKVVSNQQNVCNLLNNHFISKPAKIGNSATFPLDASISDTRFLQHTSVQTIINKCNKVEFNFKHVSTETVCSSIKKLKNKAPGHDKISAKLLKIASPVISPHLAPIFNSCVDKCIFPSAGKLAEVTPGYKRGADTDKSNYRPLSVLPSFGKLFEDLMLEQMVPANKVVLHPLISAYREGYGCQDVLLNITSKISGALDKGKYVGAVATDLSAAFDCLPPSLIS